ncbi:MAG TPA: hypothetical protein DD420_00905 [Streptomyces sp.]|nr:hypothetical protein [Streptomyces sp.]
MLSTLASFAAKDAPAAGSCRSPMMVCAVCGLSHVTGFPSASLVRSLSRVFSRGSIVHGLLLSSTGSTVSHSSRTRHS